MRVYFIIQGNGVNHLSKSEQSMEYWDNSTGWKSSRYMHACMHAYIHIYAYILIRIHTYVHTCRPSICGIASRSMSFFWFAQNPKTFRSASSTFEIQCKGNGRVGYPLPHTYICTFLSLHTYVHTLTFMHLFMYAHNQLLSSIFNIDVYVCMYVYIYVYMYVCITELRGARDVAGDYGGRPRGRCQTSWRV
jgi:hypothetical protein